MGILGGLIALTLGAGCADTTGAQTPNSSNLATKSAAPQPSALQVGAAAPSTPAYVPPTQPPAYAEPMSSTPDPVITSAPTLVARADETAGTAAGGSNYTVQHGDTLFRIAKEHYGDGKQWKRIASANPGLTPANLKAGQKIVLP